MAKFKSENILTHENLIGFQLEIIVTKKIYLIENFRRTLDENCRILSQIFVLFHRLA